MIKRISFSEWTPDAPEVDNPVFDLHSGWPGAVGYRPPPGLNTGRSDGNATAGPVGGAPVFSSDGARYMFFATQDRIFRLRGTTLADVSGAVYTAPTAASGGRMEFVQWGDDVIASNWVDDIARIQPASASSFAVLSSASATPRAKTIAESRNFLIAGYTHDSTDGTSPQRVQWSALNDPSDFAVSAVTQADFTDLNNAGGSVVRIIGGENPIVFQERAIQRMTYVGTPLIWQFDEIQADRGLFAPGAAARQGNLIFYLSSRGFEVLVNGSASQSIGAGKVDNWFFKNLDHSRKDAITCAVSMRQPIVVWTFPYESGDTMHSLVYNYQTGKWGRHASNDNAISVTYINEDAPDFGQGLFESIGEVSKQGSLTSIASRAMSSDSTSRLDVETGWFELEPGRSSMILGMRPGIRSRAPADTISNYFEVSRVESLMSGDVTTRTAGSETVAVSTNQTNRYTTRVNGKQHKIRWKMYADNDTSEDEGWLLGNEVTHLDIEYKPTGNR